MICEACREAPAFADLGGLCQECSDDLVENTRRELAAFETRPWRLDWLSFVYGGGVVSFLYGSLVMIADWLS